MFILSLCISSVLQENLEVEWWNILEVFHVKTYVSNINYN